MENMKKRRPVEETTVCKNRMLGNGLTDLVLASSANRNTVIGNTAKSNDGFIRGEGSTEQAPESSRTRSPAARRSTGAR